jgi:hypothetical protein
VVCEGAARETRSVILSLPVGAVGGLHEGVSPKPTSHGFVPFADEGERGYQGDDAPAGRFATPSHAAGWK